MLRRNGDHVINWHREVVSSHGKRVAGPSELLDVATLVQTEDIRVSAADIVVGVLARLDEFHSRPVPSARRGLLLVTWRTNIVVVRDSLLSERWGACRANIVREGG